MGNNRILLFSDTHIPFHHKDTIPFLKAIKTKYNIDATYCLGDEIDNLYLNFHTKEQTVLNPIGERSDARKFIKELQEVFPKMSLLNSNHGDLPYRKAQAIGLLPDDIKSRKDRLKITADWEWYNNITIKLPNRQSVFLIHNYKGNVLQAAKDNGVSIVQAHYHSNFSLQFWSTPEYLNFAIQLPCLIDKNSDAFNYINPFKARIMLGAAVIINGVPKLIPLIEDKDGRWNRKIN